MNRSVTIVLTDNPLRGQDGQNDCVIVVSGDLPDLASSEEALTSPAVCAAVSMLAHLSGASLETTFVNLPWGSSS